MDLSSILPLIMNSGNQGDNSRIASVLSAMNGNAQRASAQKSGTNNGVPDTAALLDALMNKGENNSSGNTANLMNILSLANQNRSAQRKPKGLKPIKDIVPNDILGILVKRLNS